MSGHILDVFRGDLLCHQEVSRDGERQSCDKTAIGIRDGSAVDDGYYPVCKYHANGSMVSLAEIFDVAFYARESFSIPRGQRPLIEEWAEKFKTPGRAVLQAIRDERVDL